MDAKKAAHAFWVFSNWWGGALGWPLLAPLHRVALNLSLHGLGYDNARHTGEEWFIAHILPRYDVESAIDVGANVGAYSALLARHLSGAIYAVEPSSSSFAKLSQFAAETNGRVVPVKAAISDMNGSATLFSREELSEKASLSLSPGEETALREEVRTVTLDALVDELGIERCDFIKIDTEGFEREVLEGMQQTLEHLKPRFVQFEFNRGHLYRGVTLFALCVLLPGYEFYRLLPRGWIKIDPRKQADNIFMFSNIIAKRID